MSQWTLPNVKAGGTITVSGNNLADAQQNAANATGVSLSAQQGGGTFGANTNNSLGGGSSGGGGGGGGGNSGGIPPELAPYVAAQQAASGFSIKELEEKKREFDANLEWQKQMWQNQGLPQLAIQQRAADLEQAKFEQLVQQANFSQSLQTRQQDLAQQVQLGQLNIAQAQQQLANEIQHGQLAVSQGQLGLDTLKTAASLSGPENWIQASNFNRGVAGDSQLPGFVSDLLSGRSTATMGGPAAGAQMSNPLSMQGMAEQMGAPGTAQSATGNPGVAAGPAAGGVANPSAARNPNVPAYTYTPPAPLTSQGAAAQSSVPSQAPSTAAMGAQSSAGFWSRNQDGSMPFTPTGGSAVSASAPGVTSSSVPDPDHMARFYATAMQSAGSGGNTGGANQATSSGTPQQQQTDASANALSKVFAAGGQALGPQQLEGLTPTEMKMFTGGGSAIGADVPGYVQAYQNSRVGQKTAMPSSV